MSINDHVLIKDLGQVIELYPNYAIIKCRGKWLVDDIKGIKIEREFDTLLYASKFVHLEYSVDLMGTELIYIVLFDDWQFFFKDKEESKKLFYKLVEWKG